MSQDTETPSRHVWEYGCEKLEEALAAVHDNGADLNVLAPLELALMAFTLFYGDAGSTITLNPSDVIEYVNELTPECICPPSLVARGGFRSGCPIHA